MALESSSVAEARCCISGIGTPNAVVDAAQLRQVGQLVRSGDVTDGRKQRVLHQRPQQHVRAELGRIRLARAASSASSRVVRRGCWQRLPSR